MMYDKRIVRGNTYAAELLPASEELSRPNSEQGGSRIGALALCFGQGSLLRVSSCLRPKTYHLTRLQCANVLSF